MKLYPGAFGRFAFNFEYAGTNTGVRALDVGVSMDAYGVELPIMASDYPRNGYQQAILP